MVDKELAALVRRLSPKATDEDIERSLGPAKRKLDDLINRFGDDNGQRRSPNYLAHLISEDITVNQHIRYFVIKNAENQMKRARCI